MHKYNFCCYSHLNLPTLSKICISLLNPVISTKLTKPIYFTKALLGKIKINNGKKKKLKMRMREI